MHCLNSSTQQNTIILEPVTQYMLIIHGIGVILNFNEISSASIIYYEIKSIMEKSVSAKSVILTKKKLISRRQFQIVQFVNGITIRYI